MILDTSVLIALLRGDEDIRRKIEEYEKKGELLRTTAVCAFELFYGAYVSSRREENLDLVERLLEALEVLTFDERAARIAASVLAELRKRGEMIDVRDLFIAAIALSHGDTVATRDKAFKRITGLNVELW